MTKKIVKFTGILLGAIAILLVLSFLALILFFNPDKYKPLLAEQVKKYTGRSLVIDGQLSWTLFPNLGVKVGHMQLSNPDNFKDKTFVEVDNATIGVRLMPLLHGKIESGGIAINGMKLHLIKNADGQVNWLLQAAAPATSATTQPATSDKTASTHHSIDELSISTLDVSDASVSFVDEQINKSYNINHFDMHAKDIHAMQPFPINTAFDFSANNPVLTGHVSVSSTIALDLNARVFTLRKLNFSAQFKQDGKTINSSFSGDVVADMNQQTIEWTDFNGNVANMNLTGKLNVQHLETAPVASGHFQLMPFDLRETLKSIGQNVDNLQAANNVKGDLDFTAGANAVNAQGNLSIESLIAAKLKVNNINVKAHFQNGVLNLDPISANLYQGNLDGQAKVDVNNAAQPSMSFQVKLSNIQAEPLMQDVAGQQKIKLIGTGNIELQATTAGTASDALVRNLNGTSKFSFSNGSIVGLDVGYMVDSAAALVNHQSSSATNNDKTNFGNLTGTAIIRNGIILNNDLLSDSPRFLIKGGGTINLVDRTINYTLQTSVKQQSGSQGNNILNLYGVTLPITITGSLDSPSVHLDSGVLVKAIAKQQLQKAAGNITKQILPGGAAGQLLNGKGGSVLNGLLGH